MRVREICLDAGNHERYQELFALGYQTRPTMPLPDPATRNPECARRTRAPPRESGADLRGSVDAIVVCHVSEITSK